MTLTQAAKWFAGLTLAGALLLMVSFFVADRRLDPPFEEADLAPLTVPAGEPMKVGTVLYDSDRTGNYELYAMSPESNSPIVLTNDDLYDSWRPRLSPDRRTVLFYRSPAGVHHHDPMQASLWMVAASGGDPIEVLPLRSHGWIEQGHAEWSPEGDELVMMGGRPRGEQIWITSVDGRAVRSVANDPGDNRDPSWSPDRKRILYTACPDGPCRDDQREVFVVLAATGVRTRLTTDDLFDEDPHFSPDGRSIVMRTRFAEPDEDGDGEIWDLRVMPTNRSQNPRRVVTGTSVSAMPHWLDDERIIFQLDRDLVIVTVEGEDLDVSPPIPFKRTAATEEYPSS